MGGGVWSGGEAARPHPIPSLSPSPRRIAAWGGARGGAISRWRAWLIILCYAKAEKTFAYLVSACPTHGVFIAKPGLSTFVVALNPMFAPVNTVTQSFSLNRVSDE